MKHLENVLILINLRLYQKSTNCLSSQILNRWNKKPQSFGFSREAEYSYKKPNPFFTTFSIFMLRNTYPVSDMKARGVSGNRNTKLETEIIEQGLVSKLNIWKIYLKQYKFLL